MDSLISMKKSGAGLFNQGRIVRPQIKRDETEIDKTRVSGEE
jgi:hypothetical protein